MTWLERLKTDPTLRAFVDAEVARAGIELQTAKDNAAHWQQVAERLKVQLDGMQEKRGKR